MAISDDTRALVAAQLTAAWATRMGRIDPPQAGSIGPQLLAVYDRFVSDLAPESPDPSAYVESLKKAL